LFRVGEREKHLVEAGSDGFELFKDEGISSHRRGGWWGRPLGTVKIDWLMDVTGGMVHEESI